MPRIVLIVVVCGALLIGLVHGCGARVEVAKDKIQAKIDSLLGSMDVKRKEIEISVTGLKEGINGLRKAKIKAQVCADQISRQAKPQEEKLASMDAALQTLRGHLEATKPVEIAGKTYTPQELSDLAGRMLMARKACTVQLTGFHDSQARLGKVVDALERKQQDAERRLADIEGQLAVIDSNRIALTAMQRSAEVMGETDGNLGANLNRLQEKVTSLYGDVEAELRCEDEPGDPVGCVWPELTFLRLVSWAYVKFIEAAEPNLRCIMKLFHGVQLDADRVEEIRGTIVSLRTFAQHHLQFSSQHDQGTIERACSWFERHIARRQPEVEDLERCVHCLLHDITVMLEVIAMFFHRVERDDFRDVIIQQWRHMRETQGERHRFEAIVAEVIQTIGREELDARVITDRLLQQICSNASQCALRMQTRVRCCDR
jgi:phage shock protein A/cell division septum initiation protein DivIVA